MPMYEYQCNNCKHVFTKVKKIDDRHDPLSEACPNCKGTKCIRQLISIPAVISPFRIDGLKKPGADFRERVKQIKSELPPSAKSNLKDY